MMKEILNYIKHLNSMYDDRFHLELFSDGSWLVRDLSKNIISQGHNLQSLRNEVASVVISEIDEKIKKAKAVICKLEKEKEKLLIPF